MHQISAKFALEKTVVVNCRCRGVDNVDAAIGAEAAHDIAMNAINFAAQIARAELVCWLNEAWIPIRHAAVVPPNRRRRDVKNNALA